MPGRCGWQDDRPWKAPRYASSPRSRTPTGGTASVDTCSRPRVRGDDARAGAGRGRGRGRQHPRAARPRLVRRGAGVRRGRRAGRRRARAAGDAGRRHAAARRRRQRSTWSSRSTCSSTSSTTTPVPATSCACCGPAAPSWWPFPATRGCGPRTTRRSATSGATPARRSPTCCAGTGSSSSRSPRGTCCCAPSWPCGVAPAAAATSSDLHPLVNLGLRAVITAERYLPVRRLPGVSLLVTARRPG